MWLCANGVVCFCVSVSMQFRVVVFVSCACEVRWYFANIFMC